MAQEKPCSKLISGDQAASRKVRHRVADEAGVDRERVSVWISWPDVRRKNRNVSVSVQGLASGEVQIFVDAMKRLIPPDWDWSVTGGFMEQK